MAIITKSSTSGNWNATSSWVGGVVPTSVDDVIFDATSAGVILNVSSSVKSLNMTGFATTGNTFTQSATLTLAGSTNSAGISFTAQPNFIVEGGFAWTAGNLSFTNLGWKQNDTIQRFLNECDAVNITLHSDWHIGPGRHGINGSTPLIQHNNYKIRITSNRQSSLNRVFFFGGGQNTTNGGIMFATYSVDNIIIDINDTILFSSGFKGNVGIKLVSGTISSAFSNLDNTTNSGNRYGTTGLSFMSINTTDTNSFTKTGGNLSNKLNIELIHNTSTFIWDCDDIVENFYLDSTTNTAGYNNEIRCLKPLNVKNLIQDTNFKYNDVGSTGGATTIKKYLITGVGGLSASNYFVKSNYTKASPTNSGGVNLVEGVAIIPRVPSLRFTSDATHKIGKFFGIGMTTDVVNQYPAITNMANVYGTFSSQTASVPATIQLGNDGFTWGYGFQDLNFTSKTMYAINGTLQNTTGVIASYPTAGGGGGAFTFVN